MTDGRGTGKTHCVNGHEYTPKNTKRNTSGTRSCKTCANQANSKRHKQQRAQARAVRERKAAKRILGLPESFWSNVVVQDNGYETQCLIWTSTCNSKGYGVISAGRRQYMAHKVSYEAQVAPVPERDPRPVLDHLCRVHACVNVDHLELVTDRINVLRGESFSAVNAAKTHCIRGHEFNSVNTRIETSGQRVCRECKRIRGRRYDAQRRPRRHSHGA